MERLPGFRDFYPEPTPHADVWSADARQYIFERWRKTARSYGFREYDGPPLEPTELFTAKSGSEIVGQLYNFVDKGEREVALRPEMTPTLARMVGAHERSYKKPMKWFALPQLFRYERQQKGRLREHFQLNADVIGESDPAADAELIALLIDVLRSFGLTAEDFVVRLSSRQAWQDFYSAQGGPADQAYAFYQIIDKWERETPAESERKLFALGVKAEKVAEFITASQATPALATVLENLRNRGLDSFVKIDYQIIRGLAYYTGVVFEAFDRGGNLRAIAGGGRYDNLIKTLTGGRLDLPALGFGMGDVVLLELLKARGKLPSFSAGLDVFCLIETESLRAISLRLIQQLREAGLSVDYSLTPAKPDRQFKRATESGARTTIRIDTTAAGAQVQPRLLVKDLSSRAERSLEWSEAIQQLQKPGSSPLKL